LCRAPDVVGADAGHVAELLDLEAVGGPDPVGTPDAPPASSQLVAPSVRPVVLRRSVAPAAAAARRAPRPKPAHSARPPLQPYQVEALRDDDGSWANVTRGEAGPTG